MELIIYITSFIIGTVFGSFFTLAVYRLPLKQDITHERSYCPNCNHKLGFWDMIPIFSYLFLKGKCKYCGQKIRPRYLILEIISGITFLLFTLSLNLNIFNLSIYKMVYLIFGILYIATLFIIAGIDKEKHLIQKSVLIFGLIVELIYIIYLYIFNFNVYKYVIYLIFIILIAIFNILFLRKKGKENYTLSILLLCFYLLIASTEEIVIITIITTLLAIAIKQMFINKKDKKENIIKQNINIPIGYYLCVINIVLIIIKNFLIYA